MKKIIILFILGTIGNTNLGIAQENSAGWQSNSIIIDGNDSDWKDIPRFYDANTGLVYNIKNDSTYLYMFFKTSDSFLQKGLRTYGLTIFFKIKAKPRILASIALQNKLVMLNGFACSKDSLCSECINIQSINISAGRNSLDEFVYEFRIPFREFYGDKYTFSKIAKNAISLRISSEAFRNGMFSGNMAMLQGTSSSQPNLIHKFHLAIKK